MVVDEEEEEEVVDAPEAIVAPSSTSPSGGGSAPKEEGEEADVELDMWSPDNLVDNANPQNHPLHSRYICSICFHFFKTPVALCVEEKHMACRHCATQITNKTQCPLCRQKLIQPFVNADLCPRWMADDLKVKCPRHAHGCTWTGAWGLEGKELHAHFHDKCSSRFVVCTHTPCGARMRAPEMEHHQGICGYAKVECGQCKTSICRIDRETHPLVCPDETLLCKYLDENGEPHSVLRKDMVEHVQTCVHALTPCQLCQDATEKKLWTVDDPPPLEFHSFLRRESDQHWRDFFNVHMRVMHAKMNAEWWGRLLPSGHNKRKKDEEDVEASSTSSTKKPKGSCIRCQDLLKSTKVVFRVENIFDHLPYRHNNTLRLKWNPRENQFYAVFMVNDVQLHMRPLLRDYMKTSLDGNVGMNVGSPHLYAPMAIEGVFLENGLFLDAFRDNGSAAWRYNLVDIHANKGHPLKFAMPVGRWKSISMYTNTHCSCLWILPVYDTTSSNPPTSVDIWFVPTTEGVACSCGRREMEKTTIHLHDGDDFVGNKLVCSENVDRPVLAVKTTHQQFDCASSLDHSLPRYLNFPSMFEPDTLMVGGPTGIVFYMRIVASRLVVNEVIVDTGVCQESLATRNKNIKCAPHELLHDGAWDPITHQLLVVSRVEMTFGNYYITTFTWRE